MALKNPLKWIISNLAYALLAVLLVACLLVGGQRPLGEENVPDGPDPTALPFCSNTDPKGSPFTDRGHEHRLPPTLTKSAILVSTLDGRITALDSANGSQLWSHATGNGDLLSSTISNHEFTSQGKWVRLVPSLEGDLYTFDGENMGAALASVDALLSNSLKMSDDTVVTGGKEVHTYGIDLATGLLRYSCGAAKCQYFNTSHKVKDDEEDVLLLNLLTKTVRAVSARNGSEKWNYSVGQHEAKMAPSKLPERGCHAGSGDRYQITADQIRPDVKFVPSEGMVLAFAGAGSYEPVWDHKFETPIIHAWSVVGREVQPLDLFENSYNAREDATTSAGQDLPRPILYIGTYNKQLYIIESRNMQKNIPLEYKSFGIDLTSAPPQVIWQPYLFTAHSRTPTILGRKPPNDLALISHVGPEESTALVVSHNGIEYPFDNGFYLYPSRPLNVNAIHIDFESAGIEPEPESFDQIIIISLWYWWKEVLVISLSFAIVVNLCITRHLIAKMQKKFTRESHDTEKVTAPAVKDQPAEAAVPGNSLSDLQSQTSSESTASMTTPPAEFVSRYQTDFEPVQKLGKGGFGVVFHARNKIDDCDYAIKRICMPNRNECKERIMREVKALAKLDHAGIVRYYNSWLECPPPRWQEQVDRQWCTGGEGFLTPSATMSLEELQRAYGLRAAKTRAGQGWNAKRPSTSTPLAGEPSSRILKNAPVGDANSNWSDLPDDESEEDSSSDSESTADPLSGPAKPTAEESSDSFIVFASDSQQAGKSGVASDVSSLAGGATLSLRSGSGDGETGAGGSAVAADTRSGEKPDGLRRLNHPVLSPFVWEKPDRLYLYIQMQLCRKDSLKDWLKDNTESRNKLEMLDFFDQIMSAVEYVHVQGLMHRDLKPSNIFFALDGTIKVGDFGLVAATVSAGMNLTETSRTPPAPATPVSGGDVRHTNQVGTIMYMSPEQIAGEIYDHKVDIYSMGLIFFEMLVPMPTDMERHEVLAAARLLRFPASFVCEYSVEHSLVTTMLTHVPTDRPSASEVRRHPVLHDFQPRPELLRWNRRTRTASRTFSTSSSGSGGLDIQFLDGSGDFSNEQAAILNAAASFSSSSSSDTSASNVNVPGAKLTLNIPDSFL